MEATSKNQPGSALMEVRLESFAANVAFSETYPICGNQKRRCLLLPTRSRKKHLEEPSPSSSPSRLVRCRPRSPPPARWPLSHALAAPAPLIPSSSLLFSVADHRPSLLAPIPAFGASITPFPLQAVQPCRRPCLRLQCRRGLPFSVANDRPSLLTPIPTFDASTIAFPLRAVRPYHRPYLRSQCRRGLPFSTSDRRPSLLATIPVFGASTTAFPLRTVGHTIDPAFARNLESAVEAFHSPQPTVAPSSPRSVPAPPDR